MLCRVVTSSSNPSDASAPTVTGLVLREASTPACPSLLVAVDASPLPSHAVRCVWLGRHLPHRVRCLWLSLQSQLGLLLREAFGGNAVTTLVVTASPSSANRSATRYALRFGLKCRKIVNSSVGGAVLTPPPLQRTCVRVSEREG
jgi:hypothetical protein